MTQFCRYELRTTDVAAARAFYTAVLGENDLAIVPLPAEAAARGVPAHWLGHLRVDDVERTAQAFAHLGATRLGPIRPSASGGEVAIVRDSGGAVVALSTAPATPSKRVVWHLLHATNSAQAISSYRELFGWSLTGSQDLGALGHYQQFAFRPGEADVGAMLDISARPDVHPHWLFHFGGIALQTAVQAVRAAGGSVIADSIRLPGGPCVAVCDDPQGAAFALYEDSHTL